MKDMGTSKEIPRPTERPTSDRSEMERIAHTEAGARLIAKVIRDVLRTARFAEASELRDAVEGKCLELGLSCTRDQVERALDLVGSNLQLLSGSQRKTDHAAPLNAAPTIQPTEARAILQTLGVDVSGGRLTHRRSTRSRLVPM